MLNKNQRPIIYAFGKAIIGRVDETVMMEGELTRIVHFPNPHTGTILVTTRKARKA